MIEAIVRIKSFIFGKRVELNVLIPPDFEAKLLGSIYMLLRIRKLHEFKKTDRFDSEFPFFLRKQKKKKNTVSQFSHG